MNWIDLSYLLCGMMLCLTVLLQISIWSGVSWQVGQRQAKEFRTWQNEKRAALDQGQCKPRCGNLGDWKGWRSFRVIDIRPETAHCKSIYLVPSDGKPVRDFRAGQYLTLRFQPTGTSRLETRCYSLSNAPGTLPLRITVKQVPHDPKRKGMSVSRYLNQELQVGASLDIKSPAGDFFVNEHCDKPIVLLAAGVGITPLFSMAKHLVRTKFELPIVLFYGNTCRSDHILAHEIQELTRQASNFVAVNCYSQPGLGDQLGKDFHFRGRVTLPLIQTTIKTLDVEFYMCGPQAFMQCLFEALISAGVSQSQIHYEAFGPATVDSAVVDVPTSQEREIVQELAGLIAFARSSKKVKCPQGKSILDIAEGVEVPIDSGCRAGNCGTCAVRLLRGEVRYPKGTPANLEPGTCLACVAQPQGEILVEA